VPRQPDPVLRGPLQHAGEDQFLDLHGAAGHQERHDAGGDAGVAAQLVREPRQEAGVARGRAVGARGLPGRERAVRRAGDRVLLLGGAARGSRVRVLRVDDRADVPHLDQAVRAGGGQPGGAVAAAAEHREGDQALRGAGVEFPGLRAGRGVPEPYDGTAVDRGEHVGTVRQPEHDQRGRP
jgi:hypothetical protein